MNYKEIKSYEDACKALGLKPVSNEVFNMFGQDAKTMAAYHKLAVITRAINGDWQPDWSNGREPKYEPYIYTNSAGLASAYTNYAPSLTNTYIGSRLCFRDNERAKFAVKTFGDTLYKDYFRPEPYSKEQEQDTAEESSQHKERENGGGGKAIRHEDDMSDAPDFLKKVGEITTGQIIPLQEQDRENRAVILITAQDNTEDKDGDNVFAVTFGVVGAHNLLARALARFFQHKESEEIVKSAQFRVKLGGMFEDFAGVIKDIIND